MTEDLLKLKTPTDYPHPEDVDILVNAGFVVQEPKGHYIPPFYKEHP